MDIPEFILDPIQLPDKQSIKYYFMAIMKSMIILLLLQALEYAISSKFKFVGFVTPLKVRIMDNNLLVLWHPWKEG